MRRPIPTASREAMTGTELGAWAMLAGLGLFHGVNPAMGWLFAVALGLQQRSRKAIGTALAAIAVGHALSVAAVVGALAFIGFVFDMGAIRVGAAALLLGFGLYRLVRGYAHKWRAGMRAGPAELVVWSFFMATAHGAGLMAAPAVLALCAVDGHGVGDPALGVLVHSAALLAGAGVIAFLVYEKLGLAVLRQGWFNLDLVWSAALILTGLVLLAMQAA